VGLSDRADPLLDLETEGCEELVAQTETSTNQLSECFFTDLSSYSLKMGPLLYASFLLSLGQRIVVPENMSRALPDWLFPIDTRVNQFANLELF